MKIHLRSFALSCGLIWGFGVFVLTWWIIMFDGATGEPTFLGSVYRGYTVSPIGSLIGLAWASFDGLVGGLVFAWLYNALVDRMPARAPNGEGSSPEAG